MDVKDYYIFLILGILGGISGLLLIIGWATGWFKHIWSWLLSISTITKLYAKVAELDRKFQESNRNQEYENCYKAFEFAPGRVIMRFHPPNEPDANPIEVCPNCRNADFSRPFLQKRHMSFSGDYKLVWICPLCKEWF